MLGESWLPIRSSKAWGCSPLADYMLVPLRSQFVDFTETLLHEMGDIHRTPCGERDLARTRSDRRLTRIITAELQPWQECFQDNRTCRTIKRNIWKLDKSGRIFILNITDAMKIVKMNGRKLNISVKLDDGSTAADEAELIGWHDTGQQEFFWQQKTNTSLPLHSRFFHSSDNAFWIG